MIFENGLGMNEQMILEEILSEIGRNNHLSDFPAKLAFDEANTRLVNYNKASKQKEEKVGRPTPPGLRGESRRFDPPPPHPPPASLQVKPGPTPPRAATSTRMATRQLGASYLEEEEEDTGDLKPTFSGPVVK